MTWYKRLFWKTFGMIWLGSFITLLLTAFFVNEIGERKRFAEGLEYRAQTYAHLMIQLYEQQDYKKLSISQRKMPKSWFLSLANVPSDIKNKKRFAAQIWREIYQRVRIIDVKRQQSIFKNQPYTLPHHWHKNEVKHFALDSYQREYQLEINLKPKSSGAEKLMGLVFSIQAVLIVLASALVALFVSAMIVRPLNKLRTRVQSIYRGEISSQSDDALYRRGDEIGELARDFERMAKHIENSIDTQQQLMQNVSHELRAPLARLQAAAGIIEQQHESAADNKSNSDKGLSHKAVQRIMRECQRLDALIAELLDLSRLQQGGSSQQKHLVSELVQELIEDARLLHPARTFNLELEASNLKLDANYLERALGNVLNNACKYSPDDKPINISLSQDETSTYLRVRDYGQGVSDEVLDTLCRPFFRSNQQTEGFGLGLSITRQAVECMQGILTIKNHPQGGLEVTMGFTQN